MVAEHFSDLVEQFVLVCFIFVSSIKKISKQGVIEFYFTERQKQTQAELLTSNAVESRDNSQKLSQTKC